MQEFAINFKILIAQVINFGIIFFLLAKFAYKPIMGILEERKNKITQGLEDAEKAADSLKSAEKKAQEIAEKAYSEAKIITNDAKSKAEKEAGEIVAKADKQAGQILNFANNEAAKAKNKALAEVRQHMASLIVLSLEKIIGNELDNNQKEKLTAKTIEDLYK